MMVKATYKVYITSEKENKNHLNGLVKDLNKPGSKLTNFSRFGFYN